MRASEFLIEQHKPHVDEGWREVVAAAIPIAGLGFHGANLYKGDKEPPQPAPQVIQVQPKQQVRTFQPTEPAKQVAPQVKQDTQPKAQAKQPKKEYRPLTPNEHALYTIAVNSGLHGIELAQFLAQMQHESWDFKKLREVPQGKDYFKKYDPKHAPKTARILGNKAPGDGEKYKGRGFIQLTGRDNYKAAGEALGIMFVNPNPKDKKAEKLAAANRKRLETDMVLSAKVALWYWSTRVKPFVKNFSDTAAVTKYINPALYGLKDRHENFMDYLNKIK
jgi:predicted chitinase